MLLAVFVGFADILLAKLARQPGYVGVSHTVSSQTRRLSAVHGRLRFFLFPASAKHVSLAGMPAIRLTEFHAYYTPFMAYCL